MVSYFKFDRLLLIATLFKMVLTLFKDKLAGERSSFNSEIHAEFVLS